MADWTKSNLGPRSQRSPHMSKRSRKRKDRKRGGANHGKRPNS
jgi:hypothetical protein